MKLSGLGAIESKLLESRVESHLLQSIESSRVTSPPINRVESNLLQSIESSHISFNQSSRVSHISSNQSSRVTSPPITIESSPNRNGRAPNHRLRPRRVPSTQQPPPNSDAPRLRKSHPFNRCNPRQPDPHPRSISRPSCRYPAPASLQWEVPTTTTHALRTTAGSYAYSMLLICPIDTRPGILQLARMIRSPDNTPADLHHLIDILSKLHQTLLIEPIELNPTPQELKSSQSSNLLEPIESSQTHNFAQHNITAPTNIITAPTNITAPANIRLLPQRALLLPRTLLPQLLKPLESSRPTSSSQSSRI
jgi:hypothetical protein